MRPSSIAPARSSSFPRAFAALAAVLALAAPLAASPASEIKEAEEELKKAINASDLDGADRAIAKLRVAGGADAVKLLLGISQKIPPGSEGAYWRLVNGAAGFKDDEGLKEISKTILGEKGALARDLMFALGNNRSPKVAAQVYQPILEKGSDEFRLMAADSLCGIEHVEAVDVLIAVYKKEEKKKGEVQARLLAGLKWLTGADCGDGSAWEAWWKQTGRAAGLKGRERRDSNTGTVVDEIDGPRWQEVVGLEKLTPEKVLVMVASCPKKGDARACNFDDMGALLKSMKIPHTVVTKEDFEAGKVTLDKAMALLLTCTQNNLHCVCKTCVPGGSNQGNRMVQCTGCSTHDQVKHKLSQKAAQTIRDWVERGGYLFSEDWGLADVTENWSLDSTTGKTKPSETSWSKLVKSGKMMKSRTVPVVPARGRTSHPLLRGVFIDPAAKSGEVPGREGDGTVAREPGTPTESTPKIERSWMIDDDSPFIDVVNKAGVVTLMESDTLAKEGSGAVAITFLPASGAAAEANATSGKPEKLVGGRVLHVLSHFGKQQTREDEFALQNLLLNFLMEANRRMRRS